MSINEQSQVWQGVYRSFADIPYERDAFEEDVWLAKQIARVQELLAAAAAAEGPSPSHAGATRDYALPFVASTLSRADRVLSILDFGGSLGTTYLAVRAMLPPRMRLEFVVVENERLCTAGRELFREQDEISFVQAIPRGRAFDIVHAGSSIHYVDDWKSTVAAFADAGPEYILFADLPAGAIRTFVTAQAFHGRRIPVRFWNLDEFTAQLATHGYELMLHAAFVGAYLERGAQLPTTHFDAAHRLSTFCQLAFRRAQPLTGIKPHDV